MLRFAKNENVRNIREQKWYALIIGVVWQKIEGFILKIQLTFLFFDIREYT